MIEDNISFAWGEKGGPSSSKEAQFYKGFHYDGITYNLFDNVYLFKDDDPEPNLGKIVKIWEHANGVKKVKIVWFLHPSEVREYLGSYQPSEKEVFLACGEKEAPGLADINPLEVIAGKCCVICTSKDERNLQPSQADVERADFVFSRFFDVTKCTLSDELPASIALQKIELLLNKKEDLTPKAVPPVISNGAAAENVSNSLKHTGTVGAKRPREEERNPLKKDIPSILKEDDAPQGTLNKVNKRVKFSEEVAPGGLRENQINSQNLPSAKPPLPSGKSGGANGVLKPGNSLKTANKIEDRAEVPRKRDADGKLKPPTGALKQGRKAEDQVEEPSRKTVSASDKKKWFDYSGKAWVERIEIEDKEEKLVLLQNFDASLTAFEIEDLIERATQHPCTARIVTNYTYGDSTYGMAYAIFRNKDAANQVVAKLNKAYLVLDGRPLLCSKGALKIPKQSTSLPGHLAIEKLKIKMAGEEMKKAVSTSHCSQPNTIEFEMALDWIRVRDNFDDANKSLTKNHMEQRKRCATKK